MLPAAAPGSPAPTVIVTAEVITSITAPLAILKVVTADTPYTGIVTKPAQAQYEKIQDGENHPLKLFPLQPARKSKLLRD